MPNCSAKKAVKTHSDDCMLVCISYRDLFHEHKGLWGALSYSKSNREPSGHPYTFVSGVYRTSSFVTHKPGGHAWSEQGTLEFIP